MYDIIRYSTILQLRLNVIMKKLRKYWRLGSIDEKLKVKSQNYLLANQDKAFCAKNSNIGLHQETEKNKQHLQESRSSITLDHILLYSSREFPCIFYNELYSVGENHRLTGVHCDTLGYIWTNTVLWKLLLFSI